MVIRQNDQEVVNMFDILMNHKHSRLEINLKKIQRSGIYISEDFEGYLGVSDG